MSLEVQLSLHGFASGWRFPASWTLGATLRRTPWTEECTLEFIALDAPDSAEALIETLRGACHAADCGFSKPAITVLEYAEFGGRFARIMEAVFGEGSDTDEWVTQIARRPQVIIADASAGAPDPHLERDARRFLEVIDKRARNAHRVLLLVMVGEHTPLAARTHKFTRGVPADALGAVLDASAQQAWQAYLHLRTAWEAGGSTSVARLLECDAPSFRLGDERAFETYLDRASGRLIENRPADDPARDPAPWTLRHELLGHSGWSVRLDALRDAMTCGWLRDLALGRLLELERRARATLLERVGPGLVESESARDLWLHFGDQNPRAPLPCYPHAPLAPRGALAFMTLGEYVHAARQGDGRGDAIPREYSELFQTRNWLAHGHPASWAVIERVRRLSEFIG